MDAKIKSKLFKEAYNYSYLLIDFNIEAEKAFIAGGEYAFSIFLQIDFDVEAFNYARQFNYHHREHQIITKAFIAGAKFIESEKKA